MKSLQDKLIEVLYESYKSKVLKAYPKAKLSEKEYDSFFKMQMYRITTPFLCIFTSELGHSHSENSAWEDAWRKIMLSRILKIYPNHYCSYHITGWFIEEERGGKRIVEKCESETTAYETALVTFLYNKYPQE